MRRAWAKPFSMRNTGPHKHPGFLNEKGEFIDEGFKARALVAKSTIDQHLLRKFKFNPNSNEAIYARTQGLHTDLASEKEIVLARLAQSRNNAGSLQGEQRYVHSVFLRLRTMNYAYIFQVILVSSYPKQKQKQRSYIGCPMNMNGLEWLLLTQSVAT